MALFSIPGDLLPLASRVLDEIFSQLREGAVPAGWSEVFSKGTIREMEEAVVRFQLAHELGADPDTDLEDLLRQKARSGG